MELDVRRVLDCLGEPLLALDRSAHILHANAALRELLGWSRLELLGRPISTVIPGGLPGLPLNGPAAPPTGASPNSPPPPSQLLRVSALGREGQRQEVEVRVSPWPGDEGLLLVSFHPLDTVVELERRLRLCQRLNVLDAALTCALALEQDTEAAAYAVLRACGETEGWVLGTYWELNRELGELYPLTVWTAFSSLGRLVDQTLQRTFLFSEGLPGRAWARREPLWVRDVIADERFARVEEFKRQGLHGALFIPVVGSGRVYGVLELFRHERLEDREEDEALASALGHRFGRFLDRLHNEQAEHTRDAALRQLWDSDLLGLFISDLQGQVLDANPCLLRMLGYTRQDLREGRLSWSVLLPTHSHVTSGAVPRRLQADDTYQSFEGELLRKHHGTLPALLGSAGLGEGRVVTYVLDLSDWKPGQLDPHKEADARLHTLLSHVPVVLFSLNREGIFTLSEGHGLERLGLKPGQVVGLSVFDIYRTEPAVLAHTRRALEGEEFVSVEALTNGLIFETHWTPLSDAAGHPSGTLALALDVTQREREARLRSQLLAEAERARAEAELAVRTRDDFLTIASHELKTPLTSLQLQLHALLKRAREGTRPEDPSQVERLDKAQRQVRKVARMMDELLDVTQVTSGQPRLELTEVDLTLVVREVLERLDEEARRSGTQLQLRDGLPVVGRWDKAKLEQVVTNLVSNALKYGAGAPVEVAVRSSGSLAMLEVMDHGIGIAPENLERIFGKFERAVSVRKYGGFGLGLYIVRQLVEALGGAVDVESVQGEGSTFRVILPLAGPELRPTPTSPSEAGLH